MYVCVYLCTYVVMYVRTYVRIYVCMYVCMHACTYIFCMYVLCMHACTYIHMYVYMYCICTYVRTYVCIYVCACRAVHKFEWWLFVNETTNKLQPVLLKKPNHATTDTRVFDRLAASDKGLYPHCAGQVNSLD